MQEFTSSADSFNSVLLKYTPVKEVIIIIAYVHIYSHNIWWPEFDSFRHRDLFYKALDT